MLHDVLDLFHFGLVAQAHFVRQGQHPKGQLARLAFTEFTGGVAGLGDGGSNFGGIELNNSSVAFFNLFKHQALLAGLKGC